MFVQRRLWTSSKRCDTTRQTQISLAARTNCLACIVGSLESNPHCDIVDESLHDLEPMVEAATFVGYRGIESETRVCSVVRTVVPNLFEAWFPFLKKPLFVWYLQGIMIPGFLRCCRVSSIHRRGLVFAKPFFRLYHRSGFHFPLFLAWSLKT